MKPLSPEQIAAARQLQRVCDTLNANIVVIGAMAYLMWIQDPHRHTLDIDIAVTVDLDDYPRLAAMLRSGGWEQEAKREHRWTTPEGLRMDIIPAGPALRARRALDWPVSGLRMSLPATPCADYEDEDIRASHGIKTRIPRLDEAWSEEKSSLTKIGFPQLR
jgi:hypothetical protein